jgi:hypothetical protein
MDFLKNIDGSIVNLTPKGIILGNVQFESNLPVPNCILIFKYYLNKHLMYTFNYINQLYIVFDTHHTYILSSFSMINTSLTYFQVLLVYMQVKEYATKLECRVTIS